MFDLVHHNFERILTSASISRNIAKCENMERLADFYGARWHHVLFAHEEPNKRYCVKCERALYNWGTDIGKKAMAQLRSSLTFRNMHASPASSHILPSNTLDLVYFLITNQSMTLNCEAWYDYVYCQRRLQRFDGIFYKRISIHDLEISPTCDIGKSLEKFCRQIHAKTWKLRQPFGLRGGWWMRRYNHFSLSTREII
jgi:hypothetical protein